MLILLHPLLYFLAAAIYLFSKGTRTQWVIGVILAYILSISQPIRFLIRQLESKYAPNIALAALHAAGKPVHILVLGAGKNDDTRLLGAQRLAPVALVRLIEGVSICLKLPKAQLITSGPKGKGDKSQAHLMKETAIGLGIGQERIFVQEAVTNTQTEAAAYVSAFGTDTPLIVCTSAIHMPRAVAWFEANGVKQIIAAPTDYLAPKSIAFQWRSLLPSLKNLDLWQIWGKEVLGKQLIGLYENTQ